VLFKEEATCVAMCSQEEIHTRSEVEAGSLSNFETSEFRPASDLAIKKFQRSAADKVLNVPSEVRPPLILSHVFNYMRDCIVDQDRYPSGHSYFRYADQ
jgi:hypothetical protein